MAGSDLSAEVKALSEKLSRLAEVLGDTRARMRELESALWRTRKHGAEYRDKREVEDGD